MGALIRSAREHTGLRGYELAARIGKQPSYVSRLEQGEIKVLPPPEELAAIADVVGVTVLDLIDAAGYDVREPDASNLREAERNLLAAVAGLEDADIGIVMRLARDLHDMRHPLSDPEPVDPPAPRRTPPRPAASQN